MTMGRAARALCLALAALLVAAGVFLVPTIWGKPWSIEHYYTRILIEFAIRHPMLLSYARVLEPYGLDFHSDDLEDFSVEAERQQLAQAKEFLEGLRRFDRGSQSEGQLLSADILEWYLQVQVDREPFLFHDYPVEQFQGLQSLLITFMVDIHQVSSEREARSYIRRLAGFGTAMDQIIERLRFRRERGIVPPRFVLEAVQEEIQEFAGVPVFDNVLYTKLERAIGALDGLGPGARDELLRAARREIDTTVLPAYRRLSGALTELASIATDDDGVWKLPDGDSYYRWALRFHTTTDLSPDEVHRLGLAEVERIRGEMRAIVARLGHPTDDLMATLRALGEEERFLYPDSDEGRERILADFQAIIDEAAGRMGAYFGRLPRARVVVKRVPGFKEEGSAGAYYDAPAFDGSRPGVFFANLRNVREVERFGMRTLAYHEAIPGHHLQIALSIEMEGVPFFRRVIPFTAFIEGWALYAERLAAEEGFHPTPYDRLGQLEAEGFRAVRLVVDTGIHAKRWTREQAIDYMLRNTGTPETDVVAEVERYIVTPGQACAYKLGQLRILELRERARARLGDAFDLREFHDVILGSGAMPLTILERAVDRWLGSKLSS
jgi:uncharacterized protein (DUF885 family)